MQQVHYQFQAFFFLDRQMKMEKASAIYWGSSTTQVKES